MAAGRRRAIENMLQQLGPQATPARVTEALERVRVDISEYFVRS